MFDLAWMRGVFLCALVGLGFAQGEARTTCIYPGSAREPLGGFLIAGEPVWIFGKGVPRIWSRGKMTLAAPDEVRRLGLPLEPGQRFVTSVRRDAIAVETQGRGRSSLRPLDVRPGAPPSAELIVPDLVSFALGDDGRVAVGYRRSREGRPGGIYRSRSATGGWVDPVFEELDGLLTVAADEGVSVLTRDRLRLWDRGGEPWGQVDGYTPFGEYRPARGGMGFAMLRGDSVHLVGASISRTFDLGEKTEEFLFQASDSFVVALSRSSIHVRSIDGRSIDQALERPDLDYRSIDCVRVGARTLLAIGGIAVEERPLRSRSAGGEPVPGFATLAVDVYVLDWSGPAPGSPDDGALDLSFSVELWPAAWNSRSPEVLFDRDGSRLFVTARDTLYEVQLPW